MKFSLVNLLNLSLTANCAAAAFANLDFFQDQSESCIKAAATIDVDFPELKSCYPLTTLFFSTVGKVCSDKCIDVTTKASKQIADACKNPGVQGQVTFSSIGDVVSSSYERVSTYYRWSRPEVNSIACSKKSNGVAKDTYCLDSFHKAHNVIANLDFEVIPPGKTKEAYVKEKICSQCSKELYNVLKTPGEEPTLYYWSFKNSKEFFAALKSYCNY